MGVQVTVCMHACDVSPLFMKLGGPSKMGMRGDGEGEFDILLIMLMFEDNFDNVNVWRQF